MHRLFKFNTVNNQINIAYDYTLGHKIGQGFLSPDARFNFINIPKNASSEVKRSLLGWSASDFNSLVANVEHLVILRDPTDRWISGIAEFLVGNFSYTGKCNANIEFEEIQMLMNTEMFQNLLFNFVIFDNHTLPQSCFLQGLDLDTITFFYFDAEVIPRLLSYVGITKEIKTTNSALTNQKKLVIIRKLKNLLKDNPTLQRKIDTHYYCDHQLFDKVKFVY